MKLSAQGNSALTKQGFYHKLVWENESNQERFEAFKLRIRKKKGVTDSPLQTTMITATLYQDLAQVLFEHHC